jgi:hypothetical protein
MKRYLVDPTTGTILSAENAVLVHAPDNEPYDEKALVELAEISNGFPDPDLMVSFEPKAIEEHFDMLVESGQVEDDEDMLAGLTAEDLRYVGMLAMMDDRLWNAYDDSLRKALVTWKKHEATK